MTCPPPQPSKPTPSHHHQKPAAAAAATLALLLASLGDKGERGEGGAIRFAHCRLLIMARRASCTRSSGTRHGFLPSILEKVAAPSQHGHQRQCTTASLHRCIVALPFHLFRACGLQAPPSNPQLGPARLPQLRRSSAAARSPPRGARRGIGIAAWGPGGESCNHR